MMSRRSVEMDDRLHAIVQITARSSHGRADGQQMEHHAYVIFMTNG